MVKRSTKSGVDKAKKPAKAKAVKAPPPPEKPPTTQAEINRIGDIIKNARGTWFGLLGALEHGKLDTMAEVTWNLKRFHRLLTSKIFFLT